MAKIAFSIEGMPRTTIEINDAEARDILSKLMQLPLQKTFEIGSTISSTSKITATPHISYEYPPIPSNKEVRKFIESQENYKHSVESIAQNFAKRKVSSDESESAISWLNAVRAMTNRVRKNIEQETGGTWIYDRRNRQRIYTFIKQEEAKKN